MTTLSVTMSAPRSRSTSSSASSRAPASGMPQVLLLLTARVTSRGGRVQPSARQGLAFVRARVCERAQDAWGRIFDCRRLMGRCRTDAQQH